MRGAERSRVHDPQRPTQHTVSPADLGPVTSLLQPLLGVHGEDLRLTLQSLQNELSSITGSSEQTLAAYLTWQGNATRALAARLRPAAVEDLILTRRALALLNADPDRSRVVLNAEIAARREAIDAEMRGLEDELRRWADVHRVVVLDTGVFLEHERQFQDIDWHSATGVRPHELICLAVPLVVIDELDAKKRAQDTWMRNRALTSLSRIVEVLDSGRGPRQLRPAAPPEQRGSNDSWQPILLELLTEPDGYERATNNDAEITAQARRLTAFMSSNGINGVRARVQVATFDHTMALRVRYAGIDDLLLPDSSKSEDARLPRGRRTKNNHKAGLTAIPSADHASGEGR